jgi:hypothetical protein
MEGKVSASQAVATIAVTQTAEVKKKKSKRTRSAVQVDMTTVSSDVETINVDDEEGDVKSPSATTSPSAGTPRKAASPVKQEVETPHETSKNQERPKLSTDPMGDLGSHKRAKKALPKPCKPGLRSTTK